MHFENLNNLSKQQCLKKPTVATINKSGKKQNDKDTWTQWIQLGHT